MKARRQIVHGERRGRCSFLSEAPPAHSSQSSTLLFVVCWYSLRSLAQEESCVSEQESSGSLRILRSVGRLADPRKHEHTKCVNPDNTEAEEKELAACVKIWFLKANSRWQLFWRNYQCCREVKALKYVKGLLGFCEGHWPVFCLFVK